MAFDPSFALAETITPMAMEKRRKPKCSSVSTPLSSSAGKQKPKRTPGKLNHNCRSGVVDTERVRVAVRLRPHNPEEVAHPCVELQPEFKRLKLLKNNGEIETYPFDQVLTETHSQKHVYEAVAKPVVESVLQGHNGTVMAYGQTGTGKTYTLARIGSKNSEDRGIIVRAMEDILQAISPLHDSVNVSYVQLYMETLQDLLDPTNSNIPIVEDSRTGDVSLPQASVVEIKDQQSFLELLRKGEANRVVANTKLNTQSSRSHAIMIVNVRRRRREILVGEDQDRELNSRHLVLNGKLILLDLAGSERVYKSGCEGRAIEETKTINLSLSALGKCVNALAHAQDNPNVHVPVRESKLTRLICDSFGRNARTSLVLTVGSSMEYRGETVSTIMFGQRAMKVENSIKLKEELDYKSVCGSLETKAQSLIAENERLAEGIQNARDGHKKCVREAQNRSLVAENKLACVSETDVLSWFHREYLGRLEHDDDHDDYQDDDQQQRTGIETEIESGLKKWANSYNSCYEIPLPLAVNGFVEELELQLTHLKGLLHKETQQRESLEEELNLMKQEKTTIDSGRGGNDEIINISKRLVDEAEHCSKLADEVKYFSHHLSVVSTEADEINMQGSREVNFGSRSSKGDVVSEKRRLRGIHQCFLLDVFHRYKAYARKMRPLVSLLMKTGS